MEQLPGDHLGSGAGKKADGIRHVGGLGKTPEWNGLTKFGRPARGAIRATRLDYYRKVKTGLADLYERHGPVPLGRNGAVCVHVPRDLQLPGSAAQFTSATG